MDRTSVEDAPLLQLDQIHKNQDQKSGDNEQQTYGKTFSISWVIVFMVGVQVGAGILILPSSVANAGWSGLALLVVCGICAAYCGILLGNSCTIVRERYKNNATLNNAYPEIAEIAVGVWFRILLSVLNTISLIGSSTVFLLLSAVTAASLMDSSSVRISYCYWVLIMAAVVTPVLWFRSPSDFRYVGLGALIAILITVFIIIAKSTQEIIAKNKIDTPSPTGLGFFFSIGTMAFVYGAVTTFPNLHQEMRDPSKFNKSIMISSICIIIIYEMIAILGYLGFGNDSQANITVSLGNGGAKIAAQVFLILHCITAIAIIMNPVFMDLENISYFNIPYEFGWRRCVLRTSIVLLMVFIGESIPNFNGLLSLVGSTTLTFPVFIAPGVIYGKLCAAEGPWKKIAFPLYSKLICLCSIIIGLVGGTAGTYSAIQEMITTSFIPPCYVNITAASEAQDI